MPRRKIDMRLIENARDRAVRYAKRTKGLQKKASELSTLCAVPVALVCAPAAGAGPRIVWESEEGVLDRYRAANLPPETRAKHTHRSYLENQLGKERAKLARALPAWDPALNDMTQDEARELLKTIDAALRAAGDKMAALGLPADGRLELQQVALAPDDGDSNHASGVLVPQLLGLVDMDMGFGFQPQLMPCHGETNDHGGLLERFLMQPEYDFQSGGGGGSYDVGAFDEAQAPGGYGDNAACGTSDHGGLLEQFLMQPEYGLQSGGGGGCYDVGAFNETQAPGGDGENADCAWPDLTMCYAADESWDAVMPIGYYSDFTNAAVAPEHYSAQDVTGGYCVDTLPLEYPMGMEENFGCLDTNNSYAAHWQADGFQSSDVQLQPSLPLSVSQILGHAAPTKPSIISIRHILGHAAPTKPSIISISIRFLCLVGAMLIY